MVAPTRRCSSVFVALRHVGAHAEDRPVLHANAPAPVMSADADWGIQRGDACAGTVVARTHEGVFVDIGAGRPAKLQVGWRDTWKYYPGMALQAHRRNVLGDRWRYLHHSVFGDRVWSYIRSVRRPVDRQVGVSMGSIIRRTLKCLRGRVFLAASR